MAPRKRKGGAAAPGGEEKPPTVTIITTATAAVSRRVTRSSTRGASAGGPGADSVPEPPVAKKAKVAGRKKKKAAEEEENVADGKVDGEADGGDGEDREEEGAEDGEKGGAGGALDAKAKTVVIEHCKQCNSFKTRAVQVKNGLEKGVPGIIVVVNPDKPRRGCFEIREQGGEKFISLLDMKRPFGPMKALDMDKVILDIIDKVKA